jgi:hypothetical protein
MTFIGYFEFTHNGIIRLGLFSLGANENTYSVELFDPVVQELEPVGEKHLRYLPMVLIDRRIIYQLSTAQTADKRAVSMYICQPSPFLL